MIQALQKSQYSIVKVRPFIHTIEPNVVPIPPVMVIGSTTLVQIAKENNWKPGAFFNKNFDYEIQMRHYPMLNSDALIGPLATINPPWEEFFIRPTLDTKLFAGEVITREDFQHWKEETTIVYSDGYTSLTPYTIIMAAPLKVIYSETRLFMVNGRVITGSVYRLGGKSYQSPVIDTVTIRFAERLAERWQPDRAYCLDVADTPEGLKVVEINCINSAGFYKSDASKIVQSIERMFT